MSKGSRYVLGGKTVKTSELPVAGFSMKTTGSDAADYQNPAFDVTKSVEMIPLGTLKQQVSSLRLVFHHVPCTHWRLIMSTALRSDQ